MSDVFQGHSFVNINKLQLTSLSTNRTIDLRRLFTNMSVVGSIFAPTYSGTIHIDDHTGLIYDMPLVGEEILEMELVTPNHEPFEKTMHVHRPENINHAPNGTTIGFDLRFVSSDQVRAIAQSPSQAANQTIDQIVRGILTNNVQTGLDFSLEQTRGIERLVIPNGWNCWQTIEFLRQRAVSPRYDSPFVFFEDRTKFNFVSIEWMVQLKKTQKDPVNITAIPFNPGAGEGDSKATVLASQYRNAENFHILEKSDTASMINNGGMNSQTSVLSLIDKTFISTNHSYRDLQTNVKQSLGANYNPTQSDMWSGVLPNTNPVVQYVIPVDATNRTEFATNASRRQMFARHFGNIKVAFMIYGDSSMEPGDLINITAPRPADRPQYDPQLDGIYVVAQMQHNVSDQQMMTIVEAHKYGFAEQVF